MTDWETPDEIEALMSEDPVGDNAGSMASRLTYTDDAQADGLVAPTASRSLDSGTRQARQFSVQAGVQSVRRSNMHWHGGVSGLAPSDGGRTLSAVEMGKLDRSHVRVAALDRLGFSEADMAVLDRDGNVDPALRVRFEARLLEISEAGGRMTDLARALGWSVVGAARCHRMSKALTRARKRRDGVPTGQARTPEEVRAASLKGACGLHRIARGRACNCGQHAHA